MLLIVADKHDKHSDIVCRKLEEKNIDFFRLNLDTESLKNTVVSYTKHWEIEQNNTIILQKEITSIWVRRPFVELTLEEADSTDAGFKIWRGEWNKTLLGLYNSLKSVYTLNSLSKSYQAENKYLQIENALSVGFIVPEYIVSNNKDELINFVNTHVEVVMKPMNQEFYRDDRDNLYKGLYVNKITIDDLQNFNNNGENPIFLQKYIEKSYEVRYTVVGDNHHVCKIDSQKSNIANIDWRRYDIPNTPHYPISPPIKIKNMITKFMKNFDLSFGALDFIVTPNGDWIFLEINTMGQWLWIEELTGLDISGSIVEMFSKHELSEMDT